MYELLKEKLSIAKELRDFTKKIMEVSLKTEYDKINSMIDEREKYIKKINEINTNIGKLEKENTNSSFSSDIKTIKKELRITFSEIAEIDNLIRKNISSELKNVKAVLNQPDSLAKSLNLKV